MQRVCDDLEKNPLSAIVIVLLTSNAFAVAEMRSIDCDLLLKQRRTMIEGRVAVKIRLRGARRLSYIET